MYTLLRRCLSRSSSTLGSDEGGSVCWRQEGNEPRPSEAEEERGKEKEIAKDLKRVRGRERETERASRHPAPRQDGI